MYADPQHKASSASSASTSIAGDRTGSMESVHGPNWRAASATQAKLDASLNDSAQVQSQLLLGDALSQSPGAVAQRKLAQIMSDSRPTYSTQRPIQRLKKKTASGVKKVNISKLSLEKAEEYLDDLDFRDSPLIEEKGDADALKKRIRALKGMKRKAIDVDLWSSSEPESKKTAIGHEVIDVDSLSSSEPESKQEAISEIPDRRVLPTMDEDMLDADFISSIEPESKQQALSTSPPESKQEMASGPPVRVMAPFKHISPGTAPDAEDMQIKVKFGFIAGLELLRWFQQMMQDYIKRTHERAELSSGQEVLGGPEWILTAGKMAGDASRSKIEQKPSGGSWLGTEPVVSASGTKMKLAKKNKTERLYLGKDDASYEKIVQLLDKLKQRGLSDPDIATALLAKMKGGGHFNYMEPATNQFFDFLNALMFGLEGSRANLTFATAPMTLEFIASGQMSFQQAFYQNEYGGEFPLASLQTGTGNLTSRREFIEGTGLTHHMGIMERQPTKHQVPVKEMYTFINWTVGELGEVLSGLNKGQAKQLICERFLTFLDNYYGGTIAPEHGGFVDASELVSTNTTATESTNKPLEKRKRAFSLDPNKRRMFDAPETKQEEEQQEKLGLMQEDTHESLEKELQVFKTERRRAWMRRYLNQQASRNPMANTIILNIIRHPEQANEILDRLRVNGQGQILGYYRGG